jgi:hypothetical protein
MNRDVWTMVVAGDVVIAGAIVAALVSVPLGIVLVVVGLGIFAWTRRPRDGAGNARDAADDPFGRSG